MVKRIRKTLQSIVMMMMITALMVEAVLYFVDPLGITRAYYGVQWIQQNSIYHPTGYHLADGVYNPRYHVTIVDGLRVVPDSNNDSDCVIAVLGDSFAFGFGVDDENTFTSRLARDYRVQWINTAQVGYNATQALLSRQYYDADGYIYLHTDNDNWQPARYVEDYEPIRYKPSMLMYRDNIATIINPRLWTDTSERVINDVYISAMDELTQDDSVIVFAFDDVPFGGLGAYAQSQWSSIIGLGDVYLGHHVSAIDYHPNATGHRLIANAMLPYVHNFLADTCG